MINEDNIHKWIIGFMTICAIAAYLVHSPNNTKRDNSRYIISAKGNTYYTNKISMDKARCIGFKSINGNKIVICNCFTVVDRKE